MNQWVRSGTVIRSSATHQILEPTVSQTSCDASGTSCSSPNVKCRSRTSPESWIEVKIKTVLSLKRTPAISIRVANPVLRSSAPRIESVQKINLGKPKQLIRKLRSVIERAQSSSWLGWATAVDQATAQCHGCQVARSAAPPRGRRLAEPGSPQRGPYRPRCSKRKKSEFPEEKEFSRSD